MSPGSISARLAAVRMEAQIFVEHADDQARQLDALVAAAHEDVRYAEAAASRASDHGVHDHAVSDVLGAQLARTAANPTIAKCTG